MTAVSYSGGSRPWAKGEEGGGGGGYILKYFFAKIRGGGPGSPGPLP